MFSCPSCRRLIDHPEMSSFTCFDVFGIERSFDVDTKELKKQFKALQGRLSFSQILDSRIDIETPALGCVRIRPGIMQHYAA